MEMPGFVEFVTSERVKVVMMLALALALCNADRVVMSVAIVPLSLSNGWSKSFAGVVQLLIPVIIPLGLSRVTNSRWSSGGLLWWQGGHGMWCYFVVASYFPYSMGS